MHHLWRICFAVYLYLPHGRRPGAYIVSPGAVLQHLSLGSLLVILIPLQQGEVAWGWEWRSQCLKLGAMFLTNFMGTNKDNPLELTFLWDTSKKLVSPTVPLGKHHHLHCHSVRALSARRCRWSCDSHSSDPANWSRSYHGHKRLSPYWNGFCGHLRLEGFIAEPLPVPSEVTIYVLIYACINIYIYTYICEYIYIYIDRYTNWYTYIYVCVYNICVRMCLLYINNISIYLSIYLSVYLIQSNPIQFYPILSNLSIYLSLSLPPSMAVPRSLAKG